MTVPIEKNLDLKIEAFWKGMLEQRSKLDELVEDSFKTHVLNTSYKALEHHAGKLQSDLNNLTDVVIKDIEERYEVAPEYMVDLRQIIVSGISCSAELGINTGIEAARLEPRVDPDDAEDHVYTAVCDYMRDQRTILTAMWTEVNN